MKGSMQRYAAFLRGVSPMNVKMPELKQCFETAGFSDVRTLLSSGNVVFSTRGTSERALERKIEAAIERDLGQPFLTFVRSIDALQAILGSDPYKSFRLAPGSKRVVTFLRTEIKSAPKLPIKLDGARILCVRRTEVFSAYIPGPRGPVFMSLIEKTFGKNVTTRTWDTVSKAAR
jgi:uncharacterized protein (DUF1697 family)